MNKIQNIFSNINFGLIVLMAFMVMFHSSVALPQCMQFTGRLHPMLVHLPIGMFLLAVILFVFGRKFEGTEIAPILHFIFAVSTFTSILSAIAGLFLALESGYEADALKWHKYSAVAFSFTQYLIYVLNDHKGILKSILIVVATLLLFITGHFGANITHGNNFLFPSNEKNEPALVADINKNSLYEFAVQPIFQKKCVGCHNQEKAKGELILTDSTNVKKGGKHGSIFMPGNIAESKIIKSIFLPIHDEMHMPPDGKTQLTLTEKNTIKQWILSGASFDKKYVAYNDKDSFKILSSKLIVVKNEEEKYTFKPAPQEVIKKLNSPYLSLHPLAINSPALEANFFVSAAFTTDKLKSLLQVKDQLVNVNLSKMPLNTEAIQILAQFSALKKLKANACNITDDQFKMLHELQQLQELSLSDNPLTIKIEKSLGQFNRLKNLYLNNTNIPYAVIGSFEKKYPKIKFYSLADINELTALSAPNVENENTVLKKDEAVQLSQVIKGAKIKYTTDGTDPDSLHGATYTAPIKIKGLAQIKAISIKEGWKNSPVLSYNFFEKGIKPDECKLLTKANIQYPGQGEKTFINNEKGPISNLKDQNWIAFREVPFKAVFTCNEARSIRKIAFCYGIQIPAYVFPPTFVKVYGSNSISNFSLLKEVKLPPVQKISKEELRSEFIEIIIKNKPYKYYKIEAQNLPKIPNWHAGRGERGWLFIDEIFFYE